MSLIRGLGEASAEAGEEKRRGFFGNWNRRKRGGGVLCVVTILIPNCVDLGIHTHPEDHGRTEKEISSAITESGAAAADDDNVATLPVIVVHDEDKDVAVLEHDQEDVAIASNDNEEPPPYTEKDSYMMADEPENYYDASQLLLDEDPGKQLTRFVW